MSLEKVAYCPVCGSTIFKPFLTCEDHTTTGETFHVEQCARCGMTLTNPRPHQSDCAKYYQSPKYISHTSASTGLLDSIYMIMRRLTLRRKYNLVKPYLKNNLLLDIGCGTGHFLHYCQDNGVTTYGVEPSKEARASFKNDKVVASLDDLPEKKFDVITLWHVLEHIYDLNKTIEKMKAMLTENGIIFIAIPNWHSPDARHYKEYWAAYDVPRHLWHFSKKDMDLLTGNFNLQINEIIPMKLDAYYVSLLSERYINKGNISIVGIIKAMIVGFRSNIQARKHINYSSLIYKIQK